MDRNGILELIGEEISRLERVRDLLSSKNGHISTRGSKGFSATRSGY